MKLAKERIHYQGLPARICWLGYGERAEFGVAINELVKKWGNQSADRDWPRSSRYGFGRFAEPRDRRHARRQRSLSQTGHCSMHSQTPPPAHHGCRSHNGGGVGIGFSQHAGMVVVADGSRQFPAPLGARPHQRSGMGILRHADAGYSRAIEFAAAHHIDIPMKPTPRD